MWLLSKKGANSQQGGDYPYITKEELKKMAASPWVSIGSHTRTHAHLEQIDSNQQREEIRSSRELLEKWTGRKIEALAFPYGGYDKSVIEAVRARYKKMPAELFVERWEFLKN